MPRLAAPVLAAALSSTALLSSTIAIATSTGWSESQASSAPERFVAREMMSTGQCVVVAEGDLEPRSTGSVSVRLYGAENPDFPTDDFLCGAVLPRDGSVERITFADTNRNGRPEVIIIMRSAGSGGYLSVLAIEPRTNNKIDAKYQLNLVATLDGLAPDADPLAILKARRDSDEPRP